MEDGGSGAITEGRGQGAVTEGRGQGQSWRVGGHGTGTIIEGKRTGVGGDHGWQESIPTLGGRLQAPALVLPRPPVPVHSSLVLSPEEALKPA